MKRIFSLFSIALLMIAVVSAQTKAPSESAMDRFLRYVKIDTQSAEDAGKFPSTEKQLVLARLLETELKGLGVQNVRISAEGIVYGMVPGNLPGSRIWAMMPAPENGTSADCATSKIPG